MERRVLLIDPCDAAREVLARRLRAQGYVIEETSDAASGADLALRSPPAAVIADLWMNGISGVQLCRLLRAEPATSGVPVILVGDGDDPKSRFWAERAGADAFVSKRRTGEVVRALGRAERTASVDDGFFFQLSGGTVDVQDRIARQLDKALFESVIAGEVRALASCGAFDRLFDKFAQFLSQIARYQWLAVATMHPSRIAVHHGVGSAAASIAEARAALRVAPDASVFPIEDEDADAEDAAGAPLVADITFGGETVARIAVQASLSSNSADLHEILHLVAAELGGPIRMTSLVEESERLAATDALTGLLNRRSLTQSLSVEMSRAARYAHPLSLMLIDVDHFKQINDKRGHNTGDRVLGALGNLLCTDVIRRSDVACRWGGEEFVVLFTHANAAGAAIAAERVRHAVERLEVFDEEGDRVGVTVSAGVAELVPGDSIESLVARADRAMYESKRSGRNRVTVDRPASEPSARVMTRELNAVVAAA